jgi:hypothetical protein
MEPIGHREFYLFAEPVGTKYFSEEDPIFSSTKLELIRILFVIEIVKGRQTDGFVKSSPAKAG